MPRYGFVYLNLDNNAPWVPRMKASTIHKRAMPLDVDTNANRPVKLLRGPLVTRFDHSEDLPHATDNMGQGSDQHTEASCGYLGPTISDR